MNVSVVILNWNELHIVKHSIDRLIAEPTVTEVVVVENGSNDGSLEYLLSCKRRAEYSKLSVVATSHNVGSSVGRNMGLAMTTGDFVFLIDGDILYVPGTIEAYKKVYDTFVAEGFDVGCIGYSDHERVRRTGMNGTRELSEAYTKMPSVAKASKWFPMAWTQYGLFPGDLLREIGFVKTYPFNLPGHGYEDDWLYQEFRSRGRISVAVDAPLYLHDGHYGLRMLKQLDMPDMGAERQATFANRWGVNAGWRETVQWNLADQVWNVQL